MSLTEEDLCHQMKVVVRVRPENTKEKATGFHKVVHVVDKHILVFDPKQQEISFFHGKKTVNRDIRRDKTRILNLYLMLFLMKLQLNWKFLNTLLSQFFVVF